MALSYKIAFLALATPSNALVFRRKGDPEPWACYMGEAAEYMGTVSVANSGQQCMQWSDAAKDEKIGAQLFLGLTKGESSGPKLEGNFCRAFSGDEKPWCFAEGAQDSGAAKQFCDVKQCPTDGPWARDFKVEATNTIKCTDSDNAPAKDCDCSCAGVAGKALVQIINRNGAARTCHC